MTIIGIPKEPEISDAWTGFPRFNTLNEKPFRRIYMVWEAADKKQTTSRPDHLWPELWKNMSDADQRKEKQKWPSKNRSSTVQES